MNGGDPGSLRLLGSIATLLNAGLGIEPTLAAVAETLRAGIPAPSVTAKRKYSEPTICSDTNPLPENFVSSDRARNIAQMEPPKVVMVAHQMAAR